MEWSTAPPWLRAIISDLAAHGQLTGTQLDALRFDLAGYPQRQAARMLGISRGAYRSRLDGAYEQVIAHPSYERGR